MKLENLFESNYQMLLEAIKSSIEERTNLEQLFVKYGITYDKTKPLVYQNYPSPSARSQIRKAVNNYMFSLCNDIITYLKNSGDIDKRSINRTISNFVYQNATASINEKSITNHINFKIVYYPEYTLQIRISDHNMTEQCKVIDKSFVYFLNYLTPFTFTTQQNIRDFINKARDVLNKNKYKQFKVKAPSEQTKAKINKEIAREKPVNSVKIEPRDDLYSSKESYKELITNTEIGIENNFFYDDRKNYNEQNFPNEKVKASFDEKMEYHERCLINDIVTLLYDIDNVDTDTIKYNESLSKNPVGSKSNSKYITFKLEGKHTYAIIRISDHYSVNREKNNNSAIFRIRRTTYTSDAFKNNLIKFINFLEKIP